ncbi:hypothetical protein DRN46_05320 [Thermococci archaeon]|nr:MAG: hypothetical protein DRN46_05320 [Thermococci archaeon]
MTDSIAVSKGRSIDREKKPTSSISCGFLSPRSPREWRVLTNGKLPRVLLLLHRVLTLAHPVEFCFDYPFYLFYVLKGPERVVAVSWVASTLLNKPQV